MHYAGIGSRRTPSVVCSFMMRLASDLEGRGYVLRSGGADGADTAFEQGVRAGSRKQIYLPWKGFNGSDSLLYSPSEWNKKIARSFCDNWEFLKPSFQNLKARNVQQILGTSPEEEDVRFVVCWMSPSGGGTGFAVALADTYDIPVFNLCGKEQQLNSEYFLVWEEVQAWIKENSQ